MRAGRAALAAAAGLACAASLAACGGSASTITNAASTGASAKFQAGLKFSRCMRAHGVSGFPDPRPAGNVGGVMLQGIPKNAPSFRAADTACRSLLPNQGRPPPLSPARQQAMLRFASCMRAHGLASFPDPQFNQTGGDISVNGGKLGLNPASSPAFKSAQAACAPALRKALGGDAMFSTQGPG
jgi:hypothetical protein